MLSPVLQGAKAALPPTHPLLLDGIDDELEQRLSDPRILTDGDLLLERSISQQNKIEKQEDVSSQQQTNQAARCAK
jgi:hypothetical protein